MKTTAPTNSNSTMILSSPNSMDVPSALTNAGFKECLENNARSAELRRGRGTIVRPRNHQYRICDSGSESGLLPRRIRPRHVRNLAAGQQGQCQGAGGIRSVGSQNGRVAQPVLAYVQRQAGGRLESGRRQRCSEDAEEYPEAGYAGYATAPTIP